MKLLVSIYQYEDGAYTVQCPSVPGCDSQGQTGSEVESNAADALRESRAVPAELSIPATV